jgi:pSer/pThr/pTyr-binding forkhead associated (FHA) protein
LALEADDRAKGTDPKAKKAVAGRMCATCGERVPEGNRFCGGCGQALSEITQPSMPTPAPGGPRKTMFFGAMQQARAKLVLIKGDGLDGVSFTLAGQEHIAGRVDAPLLFEEDPFLSPTHANFYYNDTHLVVRDEGSVNGVYIRIRGPQPLNFDDCFLIGEQVIEVQKTNETVALEPVTDGTYFYASPGRKSHFRLQQLLRGGGTGLAFRAASDHVTMGREGNDINFPDDPFISGRHARVSFTDGQLLLTDLGSKNGTFLRVRSEYKLQHGDYVFMGQQLLRVEIV